MSRGNGSSLFGRVAYGLFFVALFPTAMATWASRLDHSIHWPVPELPAVALASLLCGALLMFKGMIDLRIHGHGLPMNAYPPERLVVRGSYDWFAHPIYVGAMGISFGIALWLRSSAGLYLVTPILAGMILSLLLGYEIPATAARFGSALRQHQPLFSMPPSSDSDVGWPRRLAMTARLFLPWMVAVYLMDQARGVDFTGMLPQLLLILIVLTARTGQALRRAVVIGTVATLLGLYLELVLPLLMPRLMSAPWSTGVIQLLAVLIGANVRGIWLWMQRVSERVANSRHDWLFFGGRFRVINHSLYSALAGAIGVGLCGYVMAHSIAALVIHACVLVGAATFAQAAWGSRSLLRPFGYWGGVLGSFVGIAIARLVFDIAPARISLAIVLCGTFAQAAGRLRCLSQGCCHGIPAQEPDAGIRVWQPQSRVVLLSHLAGVPLLNTQLYSIVFNIALGGLLWGLWLGKAMGDWMIVGAYFILTGLERFAEDAYRGETQTRRLRGLPENQWIAIGAVCLGMIVAALPAGAPSGDVGAIDGAWPAVVLVGGALNAFAMSMDFPGSNRRFSRLSG